MQTWKAVNWFRFITIVGISILTSLVFIIEDSHLEYLEIIRAILHGLIAGFAFLQCPEDSANKIKQQEERTNEN